VRKKTAFALIVLILLMQAAGGTFPSAGETPAPAADEGPVPAILYMLRRDIQSGNEKRIRAALEYAAGCGPEKVRALVPEALGNPAAGRWAREAVLRRPEDFDEFAERISAFARRKGDAELMFAYPWEGRAADFKEAYSRASGRSRARLLALAARPAPPEWVVGLAEFEAENPAAGVLTADAARLVMFMAGKGEAPVSLLAVPPALPPVFYERLARACAARFDERVREGLRGALERRGEGNVEWGRKALAVLLRKGDRPPGAVSFLAETGGVPPALDRLAASLLTRLRPSEKEAAALFRGEGETFPWFTYCAACRAVPELLGTVALPDASGAPPSFGPVFAGVVASRRAAGVGFRLPPSLDGGFWRELAAALGDGRGMSEEFAASLARSAVRAENLSLADFRRLAALLERRGFETERRRMEETERTAAALLRGGKPLAMRWAWESAFGGTAPPGKLGARAAALFLARGAVWALPFASGFAAESLRTSGFSPSALAAEPGLLPPAVRLCGRLPHGPVMSAEELRALHPRMRPAGREGRFALFAGEEEAVVCRAVRGGFREILPLYCSGDVRLVAGEGGGVELEVTSRLRPAPGFRRAGKDAWRMELNDPEEADDPDGDGLTLREEKELGTAPTTGDTDGDGEPDGRDPSPLVPGRDRPAGLVLADVAAALQAGPIPAPAGLAPLAPLRIRCGTASVRVPFRQCVPAGEGDGMDLPFLVEAGGLPMFRIVRGGRAFLLGRKGGRLVLREDVSGD